MKVLAICGYSGSGKTTLLKKLIPEITKQNIRLAVIKHSHHNMDIDIPGKNSYELRKSGANQIIVASDNRWALISETHNQPVKLTDLVNKFEHVDLVLVEGFKDEAIPKIICHRQNNNKPIFLDKYTLAMATDIQLDIDIKQFDINDIEHIASFIINSIDSLL